MILLNYIKCKLFINYNIYYFLWLFLNLSYLPNLKTLKKYIYLKTTCGTLLYNAVTVIQITKKKYIFQIWNNMKPNQTKVALIIIKEHLILLLIVKTVKEQVQLKLRNTLSSKHKQMKMEKSKDH